MHDLCPKLGVPQSKMLETQRLYWTDHQRMEALVDDYIPYHSTPIWKEFAAALRGWSYTSKQMRSLPNMSKVWM